ncbi:MAG TPA: hypothetical protein VIT44_02225, partial [Cyclobacteriaceae bacterium]
VEYYGGRMELLEVGFGATIMKKKLRPGSYKAGLLFTNKKTGLNGLAWMDYGFNVPRQVTPALLDHGIKKSSPLKFAVSDVDYSNNSIHINAWAFPEKGICNDCKTYFTFSTSSDSYVTEVLRTPRTDVVSFYKNPDLLYSGLDIKLSKKALPEGSYRLGIYFKDTIKHVDHFSEIDRMIHFGMDEYATPKTLTTIPDGKEIIRSSIDELNDKEDFVLLKGWAFIDGVSSASTTTFVVLQAKNESLQFPVMPEIRTDIQPYFKLSFNTDLAGFTLKFKKNRLPSGQYKVCVMIYNKKSNTTSLQCTDTIINL